MLICFVTFWNNFKDLSIKSIYFFIFISKISDIYYSCIFSYILLYWIKYCYLYRSSKSSFSGSSDGNESTTDLRGDDELVDIFVTEETNKKKSIPKRKYSFPSTPPNKSGMIIFQRFIFIIWY